MLTPDEIRQVRDQLDMEPHELAAIFGEPADVVLDWESGVLPISSYFDEMLKWFRTSQSLDAYSRIRAKAFLARHEPVRALYELLSPCMERNVTPR